MKYWTLLVSKLLGAGLVLYGAWLGLATLYPGPEPFLNARHDPFGHDLYYTLSVILYGLFALAVLYIIVLDQRYRCRTCLRRLRMPVETGSWNRMLMSGPPRTEYICPYGHGTLAVPEVQICGIELPDWTPNEDMWKELEHLGEPRR